MDDRPTGFDRSDLAKIQGLTPRTLRTFENLNLNQDEIVSNLSDIKGSPLLGVALSDIFTDDRALAGSNDIALTDGGAKGNLSIALTPSGVAASTYGSASKLVSFKVDEKGRITLASQVNLESGNVTETTNLFFTTFRARAAISAGAGLNYSPISGQMSVAPAGTYGVPTGTVSRASFATYVAPTASATYSQADTQAMMNALQVISRTLAALIIDMQANGNLS